MSGITNVSEGTVVVIDYSGTLSRGAVQFAQPARLRRELHRSGLAEFGISEPTVFWEEIVNPTWDIGSTTTQGYAALITRRVAELAGEGGATIDDGACRAAARRFVRSYLLASVIYKEWIPVLTDLAKREEINLVIATDHYAEATPSIRAHLWRTGVEEAPDGPPTALRRVTVANSAELGAVKERTEFWQAVFRRISARADGPLVLIDDFGRNEYEGDSYAIPERVLLRRDATVRALSRAAVTAPTIVPFWPVSQDRAAWNEEVRRVGVVLSEAVRTETI